MRSSLKNSQILGLIGACGLILAVFLSKTPPEEQFTAVIEPHSQLAQASSATFSISPSSQSVNINSTFTANIILNTGGQAIYGVDVNSVRFNPSVLQVVDSDTNTAGIQIAPGALMSQVFVNTADNTSGTIQFSQVATPGTTYLGSGTLASITFRAVGSGSSNVSIDFSPGSGTDSNIAGANGDILTSVSGATYSAVSLDGIAPTAPGTPTLNPFSSTRIDLTWTASTDAVGVTGYKVERCNGSATCTSYTEIASPSSASYSDTGLTAGTIYRYRVRATDAAGNLSGYSTPAHTSTLPPPDITAPTISNINQGTPTSNSVTITWTTNEPADTQVDYGVTTSYGQSTTLNTTQSTSHSATLSGLSPGVTYNYRVKSRDVAGNLSASANSTFTTLAGADATDPSVPTGFKATPTSGSEVQLAWNASTDPVVAGQLVSGVKHYEIYRNNTLLTTTVSTAHLDTGLNEGSAYSYQVAAVDNAGNISAKTSALTATTLTYSLAVQRKISIVLEGAPATKRDIGGTVEFLDPTTGTKVYQASIMTDPLGKDTINVPSGLIATVHMRAVIPGYLAKKVESIDLRSTTLTDVIFPALPAGDFNSDKLINSLDFSYMNGKWGGVDSLADLNRDGAVNTLDFSFLSKNWLLAGE
jgi:chitodextrinase